LDHEFDIRRLLKYQIDQVQVASDSRMDTSASTLSAMLLGPSILRVEAGNLHHNLDLHAVG
jgi:hypothetical protein